MEYGLFVGRLGPEQALICRKGKAKTPTDLMGLVHVDISAGKAKAARTEIKDWLSKLKEKHGVSAHPRLAQQYVRVLPGNREDLEALYRERKNSARNVDILAVALSGALTEIAGDEENTLLRRVLFDKVQVRMIFVSPASGYVRQRAIEDGVLPTQLQCSLKDSVRHTCEVYGRFKRLYDEVKKQPGGFKRESMGSLEIRATDFCPYFTVFRTDDSVLWGIYTAATQGLRSSVIEVQKSHDRLFRQILGHFDSLWQVGGLSRNPDDTWLLKCDRFQPPTLNEALAAKLLAVEDCGGLRPARTSVGQRRE
jgi:hypothetical protein